MILVVTNQDDVTADYLIAQFVVNGVPFLRFNTEEEARTASVELRVDGIANATLKVGDDELSLAAVSAIWWRRPAEPYLSRDVPQEFRSFLVNEAATAVGGILRTSAALWVNHPEANSLAGFKPYQLARATQMGWRVPKTLITADPATAVRFVHDLPERPIIKAIDQGYVESSNGTAFSAFTRQLTDADLASPNSVSLCPVLLQERIQKRREYRVTVVGDTVFATMISGRSGDPISLDWRAARETELCYVGATLPTEIENLCQQTVKAFGLNFGALDIVENIDGHFIFLELNPNGQWAWIEMNTGQPIRDAMCQLLMRGMS